MLKVCAYLITFWEQQLSEVWTILKKKTIDLIDLTKQFSKFNLHIVAELQKGWGGESGFLSQLWHALSEEVLSAPTCQLVGNGNPESFSKETKTIRGSSSAENYTTNYIP